MPIYTINGKRVPANSLDEAIALADSLWGKSDLSTPPPPTPRYTPPPPSPPLLPRIMQAVPTFLKEAGGVIAGIPGGIVDPSERALNAAVDARQAGRPVEAQLRGMAAVTPGLSAASEFVGSKLDEAKKAVLQAWGGDALSSLDNLTNVIPGVPTMKGMVTQNINNPDRIDAFARTLGQSTGAAVAAKGPEMIPPAIQALQEYGPRVVQKAAPIVGGAMVDRALGGSGMIGAIAGPLVKDALRGVVKDTHTAAPARPGGLPDITGEPTGLPNKPITGVMPPEPPPAPATEVPAASLADLVQQATGPKPGTGIKFTSTAAEDAITELFNNNVKRKDAQTLLEDKFPDAHPETLKKIITEKYKEMIDKQRGKPAPEKTASAEPPPAEPTRGRAWQEKNLKGITDPVERERLIDAQTMKSAPPGYTLGTTIPSTEPPPAIKALKDRNISGKEFKDLFWQIATEKPTSPLVKDLSTEVTPSRTGIDKPALAKLSGNTADDIPTTIAVNRMADYATYVNETVANYANQVKIRAIDQETAIKKIQKETGASPSYAFYLFNKALKAQ